MKAQQETGIAQLIPGYTIRTKLRDSYPNLIYTATRDADGMEVVVKTLADKYPRKEHLAGLQREFRITRKLQMEGIVDVFDLIPYGHGNLAIIMARFGISLEEYLKSFEHQILPLEKFFPLALQIIGVCSRMHEQKIVHKDLAPHNILIDPSSEKICLIDFGSSSELLREYQDSITLSKWIEGSLPYISPEQTGRINRDIDYRSDFYSLGVTFFQMLTGQLPFQAQDPLEWVHSAISRQAPEANSLNNRIPRVLSAIIAKLLSKNAEDRYQSHHGLQHDLEACRVLLRRGDDGRSFRLAESDISHRFHIPQKLFGRGPELEKLESCFENAAHGAVEFCVVSGYSGVGKTVLVHELGRSIVQRQGYLIHGKFDQYRQNAAYAAIGGAFRELMRQLLGEPKHRLDRWAEKIQLALGTNAQLIIDVVPELALIIGKQPPVQDLSPAEAQNRFLILFQNFVNVFAGEHHPLVIFLDDLQWSDVPTLHLVNRLVTTHELSHLLIIGAYRDNEVDQTHPLSLTLRDIESKRMVEKLPLSPLSQDATDQLIRETLLCAPQRSAALSDIFFEKTGGNPFFTIELLKNLKDRDVIFFNSGESRWDWDLQEVKNVNYSDNVIDILVARQNRLAPETQHVLQLAACIGATFDLKTLSIIREGTMEETAAELDDALRTSMVVPLNESYKFVASGTGATHHSDEPEVNPVYKFQHDRVQQAAYSLIDPKKRQSLHLSIGRLILDHSSPRELEEKLIDVVSHFNEGRSLILDGEEQHRLIRLNLSAGIKAKQSSAYDSSLAFLKIGYELSGADAWDKDYDTTWALHNELQQAYYLTGDWAHADQLTEKLLLNARNTVEQGLVLSTRTRQYATTGRMQDSMEAAYQGLSILGFEFIENPTEEDLAYEVEMIRQNLQGREIQSLINAPDLTDESARIAGQLIMEIFPAAFLSGSGTMFPYLVLKSVNIALKFGNSPETAFAYAAYGMILCGFYNDTALGYEYGRLGVNLIERFDDIALKSRIIYVYAMFVHHWSNHWSTMTPWFRKGIEAGYQSGDLLYLAYSAQDCIIWDPRLDLESASQEHRRLLAIVRECEYRDSLDSGTLFLQMQLNFQGLTRSTFSLTDDEFDEAACVEGMYQRHFMTGISNYHIYKAEIHLLYNDAEGALEHVLDQEKRMSSVMALPQAVRFHVVAFLVRSMLLPGLDEDAVDEYLRRMEFNRNTIAGWAEHCKENFEHLRLLMDAELAEFHGQVQEALAYYEQAIASAKENGFRRDEAMANEMAGRYLFRLGLPKAADGYIQDARYIYYRWGAHRKVAEMDKAYPGLFTSGGNSNVQSASLTPGKQSITESDAIRAEMLDISSVLRASQIISGELVLDKLLKATLQVLVENAGAQKGVIVDHRDGHLFIQAHSEIDSEAGQIIPLKDEKGIPVLPVTLVNTAIRTRDPVVINNASELNAFSSDPYIKYRKPLSVMCVPLPMHGQWPSAVYLENNLTHSAFTSDRVEIIKLLAGQASISMENARIYEKQDRLVKAQQRFVPSQFLKHLGHEDISRVELGESVLLDMTVMFSDIRNFTPLVEMMTPQEVIRFLNRLYSQLGKPITAAGGFIDSYAGDGIMALFAVPPQQAVQAGMRMSLTLGEFNRKSMEKGVPPIRIGIGVNSGPLVLGTMGANERMQCSVLGDTVNLASRIEQLTRTYDAQLLIGEQTLKSLDHPELFSIRKVDCVAVKGKGTAIDLYEVLDAESEARRERKEATRSQLEEAMKTYYARDFFEACQLFSEGILQDPTDPVFSIFASRARRYMDDPPGPDWQGFEKLVQK